MDTNGADTNGANTIGANTTGAKTFAYDYGFGAQLQDGGQVRFRVWAPDCSAMLIERDGTRAAPMQARGDGWFEAQLAVPAGTRYRFRLEHADGLAVADIGARAQAGGVHGWSVVVDPREYAWQHPQWRGRPWREAVIEEVHAGLLDGFDGVRARLHELAASGITAIELMPVAEFSGARNWGYDGVLPFAAEATYGGPTALKRLIDTAHGLGLMVLLDVVYNHFGPDGNYLPRYAAQFFREDHHTPWGPGIDVTRPQVSAFFIANARYWLEEFRCDGLRIDAAHAIIDQDWLAEFAAQVRAQVHGRHVHLVLEHDDNAAGLLERGFDAQWDDDLHHALHVLLTGEDSGYYADYATDPIGALARAWREGFAWQGEPSPYRGGAPRGEPSVHLPPSAFVAFLQNHDQIGNRAFGERLSTLAEPESLAAAMAFLLLSPMVPLLFMGDEYGETKPFLFFTDYDGELATSVREGRRREFARFAEFADAGRRARIPDPNDPATFVESRPSAKPQHAATRERTAALIALRMRTVVPWLDARSTRHAEPVEKKALFARWQRGDGRTLHYYLNLDNAPCAAPAMRGEPMFATSLEASTSLAQGHLAPGSLVACLD